MITHRYSKVALVGNVIDQGCGYDNTMRSQYVYESITISDIRKIRYAQGLQTNQQNSSAALKKSCKQNQSFNIKYGETFLIFILPIRVSICYKILPIPAESQKEYIMKEYNVTNIILSYCSALVQKIKGSIYAEVIVSEGV